MTTRMLIDARHREETRVAVLKGNRIEEFDFESVEHQQIKGNIYLAKVTRVEPSLQAAFVDYGGNRHGFLAFSEIHPDYYQIPKEDRERLLAEEAEHAAEEEALRQRAEEAEDAAYGDHDDERDATSTADDADFVETAEGEDAPRPAPESNGDDHAAAEALRHRRMNLRRRYKIQDVIHRRQVLLVQVVKEERGNKGAALTSYLSLAGRYCVLMPNTTHGGGISRKISNAADRKRLKSIMADLSLPPSMGCIVRTAGLQRTKLEIRRDFDYLARLWDEIREKTLSSTAPAQIYTDSDLIRRAIRDIYNKDIDEVIVEGEEGYKAARGFMKLLMPSHARKVKAYSDAVPLFQRYGTGDQLAAMYQPVVTLKSGGYIVINPTEALVSIDINSGRSTREHGIEATAVNTNLEAAHEIARQLRLRDMAGLVVIDFIDMENHGNIRKVEKAMKMALANDRARIQVGRISAFGLMEMSRQRLRTGVLEASTKQCPHCEGTGLVRTASSAGLSALRLLEDEAARGKGSNLALRASQEAAFYLLNRKRRELGEIEARYGVRIEVLSDGEVEGARMTVEASGPPPAFTPQFAPIAMEPDDDIFEDDDTDIDAEGETETEEFASEEADGRDRDGGRKKRSRRRRGRRNRGEDRARAEGETDGEPHSTAPIADGTETASAQPAEDNAARIDEGDTAPRGDRRRRGRRGGRNRMAESGYPQDSAASTETEQEQEQETVQAATAPADAPAAEPVASDTPHAADDAEATAVINADAPVKKPRKRATKAPAGDVTAATADADAGADVAPKKSRRRKAEPVEAEAEGAAGADDAAQAVTAAKPKRSREAKAPIDTDGAAEGAANAAAAPEIVADAVVAPKVAPVEPTVTSAAMAAPAPATVEAAPAIVEAAPAPSDSDADDATPRRGWWQRTFGA